jgi:hypothetical protein
MNEENDSLDAQSVVRSTREAVEKLSGDTEHLKKLAELQNLKHKPADVVVDHHDVLECSRNSQKHNDAPGDVQDLVDLLKLLALPQRE